MALFKPLDAPPSLLGYHRQLAPSAGIKVSPICLGAMNFGMSEAVESGWDPSVANSQRHRMEGLVRRM